MTSNVDGCRRKKVSTDGCGDMRIDEIEKKIKAGYYHVDRRGKKLDIISRIQEGKRR